VKGRNEGKLAAVEESKSLRVDGAFL
jgi:hypothetical protein